MHNSGQITEFHIIAFYHTQNSSLITAENHRPWPGCEVGVIRNGVTNREPEIHMKMGSTEGRCDGAKSCICRRIRIEIPIYEFDHFILIFNYF